MTPPAVQTRFTRGRVRELKNGHNSVTVQNRKHVYMKFFHHKGLGNHLLQLCPKVMKHPVCTLKITDHKALRSVHVESHAFISCYNDELMTVFVLLGPHCWGGSVKETMLFLPVRFVTISTRSLNSTFIIYSCLFTSCLTNSNFDFTRV